METKKSRSKNAEALRIPLAFSGFLFTGGLLLASFSYTTPVSEELAAASNSGNNEVIYSLQDKQPVPDKTQPETAYVAPPSVVIRIDSNVTTPPIPIVTPPGPPVIVIIPVPPRPPVDPIEFPDVEAEFPGGAVELQRWIGTNIIYPETSIVMEEQGRVYLTFVVGADGKISDVDVTKGVSKDLDREAKRIIRNMPNWKPGEVDGKRVPTRCRLPIVFTLE